MVTWAVVKVVVNAAVRAAAMFDKITT